MKYLYPETETKIYIAYLYYRQILELIQIKSHLSASHRCKMLNSLKNGYFFTRKLDEIAEQTLIVKISREDVIKADNATSFPAIKSSKT